MKESADSPGISDALDRETALELLGQMILIRRFEEEAGRQYQRAKAGGFLHLAIGEEATIVGTASVMQPDDYLIGTYRTHGHAIARGTPPGRVMAELFGRVGGTSGGRGGSMHVFDGERRFMGGFGIVGGNLPIAAGLAFATRYRGEDDVTVCMFGDGASNTGNFGETMNLAALWDLPVVFLLENNLYGMGTAVERHSAETELSHKAEGYGVTGERVDGMDVVAVRECVARHLEIAREEKRPTLVEAFTYRFRGHSAADPEVYRDKAEVEEWRKLDPIESFARRCVGEGLVSESDVGQLREEADRSVGEAVASADASPEPTPDSLYDGLYVLGENEGWRAEGERSLHGSEMPATTEIRQREALGQAMSEEMRRDPDVFVLGEDVAVFQGAFKVTEGLLEEFGEGRVVDTPISENSLVGLGIGAAMAGLRPVVELMTVNFSLLAFDQIVNHAATIPYMFNGQVRVPMVVRMPGGGGHQLGPTHSHSFEALFLHVPGLLVACPSTAADAKGLLKSAIRDDNPVIFLEHESLYSMKGEVPDGEHLVPFGKAAIRREGSDVTIVGILKMAHVAEEAAGILSDEHGIEAEVIDPRTLRPLDLDTILDSVKKTNRAVIVEEGWPHGGVGANLSTLITEQAFDHLDAPVQRVAGADVPMPYSRPLEQAAIPNSSSVVEATLATMVGVR
jgi:pyruvate dehydrogenase E1 component alpha subunit